MLEAGFSSYTPPFSDPVGTSVGWYLGSWGLLLFAVLSAQGALVAHPRSIDFPGAPHWMVADIAPPMVLSHTAIGLGAAMSPFAPVCCVDFCSCSIAVVLFHFDAGRFRCLGLVGGSQEGGTVLGVPNIRLAGSTSSWARDCSPVCSQS